MRSRSPRVAVIGASGIGRHHAKWWHLEGAEVCAFAGTSPERVAKAEEGMKELLPFTGRSYTDVSQMLERERPDIVDVCSPPSFHYGHVREALEAGCDVFCEKPFIYEHGVPCDELLRRAKELCALAGRLARRLGLCTQYSEASRLFREIWGERFGDRPITKYFGRLEAPARGRSADPERVWTDLGPHPLSVLQPLTPGGKITDLATHFDGYEAQASFRMVDEAGSALDCEILTRNTVDPPQNVREFAFNDYRFRVEADKDDQGVYCARIETPDGAFLRPDPMRLKIRRFLHDEWKDDTEPSLNMELMVTVLDAARRP